MPGPVKTAFFQNLPMHLRISQLSRGAVLGEDSDGLRFCSFHTRRANYSGINSLLLKKITKINH